MRPGLLTAVTVPRMVDPFGNYKLLRNPDRIGRIGVQPVSRLAAAAVQVRRQYYGNHRTFRYDGTECMFLPGLLSFLRHPGRERGKEEQRNKEDTETRWSVHGFPPSRRLLLLYY